MTRESIFNLLASITGISALASAPLYFISLYEFIQGAVGDDAERLAIAARFIWLATFVWLPGCACLFLGGLFLPNKK